MTERVRPVRASRVEMTEIVMPEDTNPLGRVYGGRVMALIDKAAAIAAMRHCRTRVVTARVDSMAFRNPVRLGQILRLQAGVNAAFDTSLEVGVEVTSEDPLTGDIAPCCSAFVLMVSLDERGRPARVPRLAPRTAAERASERAARRRRRDRNAAPRRRPASAV
ncbi:MAG TPA: acyl-CoA thioesterase [Verrucomicrobiae bacterium]|nr:acyl-CoA thioesterase [Verrucomicrobiae bacterium]